MLLANSVGKIGVHHHFFAIVVHPYLPEAVHSNKDHIGLALNISREKPAGISQVLAGYKFKFLFIHFFSIAPLTDKRY